MNTDNKKYKAIFSDFDGTITAGGMDFFPSDNVVNAIKVWEQQGHNFIITTGRPYFGVIASVCKRIELTAPQIVRAGAEIVDPVSGNVLHAEYMDDEEVKRLIQFLTDQQLAFAVEQANAIYTPGGFREEPYGPIPFKDLHDLEITHIPKVLIIPFSDVQKQAVVDTALTAEFPNLHIIRSRNPTGVNWDITSLKATKHLAILRVLEMLGIPKEETIGIGDSYNDFPLLSACEYKVAMGNAIEDLKAVADFIAPPQKENGVAFVIEELLRRDK